ncbi:MAG: DMT family transporter [Verrucomicrobia bacterium]|nr:DMT family transporter [Verrucomicrobiota bacterium]
MWPALLTTVLFSISAVSANRTAKLLGATTANFWRLVVAAVLLAIWGHTFGGGLAGPALPWLVVSGCVGFGLGDLALFQSLPRLGSRLTILLVQCLAAPFAALTEWAWLGTTLSGAQILCGLTILAGVAVAIAPSEHLRLTRRTLAVGTSFGVGAAFGQGFGAVLGRKAYEVAAEAGQGIDGMTAAYQRILGGLVVAAVGLWWVKRQAERRDTLASGLSDREERTRSDWRSAWGWVVVNGLAGPALGVSCYQWALKTTPTGVVLPIVATTPLVVIPFARVMEGETHSARSLVGGLIAVLGAVALTLVT